MKSICYIVPYFGKLPSGFQLWLMSCKMNPTIDWLIFTDDKTEYDYPENVKVNYCTFDDIRKRFFLLYTGNCAWRRNNYEQGRIRMLKDEKL